MRKNIIIREAGVRRERIALCRAARNAAKAVKLEIPTTL
jgi:hypothetical protein